MVLITSARMPSGAPPAEVMVKCQGIVTSQAWCCPEARCLPFVCGDQDASRPAAGHFPSRWHLSKAAWERGRDRSSTSPFVS